ncbi:MAG TPA: hypothetical protein VF042_00455 [Gemmatimonadaceae bacterium]
MSSTTGGNEFGHTHDTNTGEKVGEAVGGVSGALTGAAVGSPAGPIGTIIGGIAGAVGGWWAGKQVADAAATFNDHDDNNYRQAYEARADRLVDRTYEDVRPAYQIGHLASENPDYTGKGFEDIEMDLQRGWTNDLRARHGDWGAVRPFAEQAYSSRSASVTAREAVNRIENSSENLQDRASDTTR